jgi:hypothetical protein
MRHDVNRFVVNKSAPELFPVMIWLAFGLLGAKQTSAAPSAGEAKTPITQ